MEWTYIVHIGSILNNCVLKGKLMILKHELLLVRGEYTNPIKDNLAAEKWLLELVEAISMNVLVGPFSVYSEMVGNTGITAGVILSTSHCVLHTFEDDNYSVLQLDLYSCSTIEVGIVLGKIKDFFNTYKLEYKFIERDKSFEVLI